MVLDTTGIISFPSLHASAALLAIYLVRGLKLIYPVTVLNLLMLAGTPVFGGHFFVDVLAGVGIFCVAVVATRWMLRA
jgi:membrane-associated phospholipid phosphatase